MTNFSGENLNIGASADGPQGERRDSAGSRYQAYPEYKDSGVEWLGDVPSHWGVCRLGDYALKIGSGKTPKGGAEIYQDDGILFLRSQNIYDDGLRIDQTECVFITEAIDTEMASTRIESGDILLNITGGSIGRSCIVPSDFQPANVNQHVCIIRMPSQFRSFMSYFMKSMSLKEQVNFLQNGGNREGLNFEQIRKFNTNIPTESEMAAIANFLDHQTAKIDTLIEQQQKLIQLLKEKRQAVISHAVTKGLNPDAPMKDSGVEWLGEVPEHWGVIPLKLIIKTRKGVAFKSDDFIGEGTRVVKASDIKQLSINSSEVYLPTEFMKLYPRAILKQGDIILSTVGSTPDVKNSAVGQIGMLPDDLDGSLLNQNTVVFDLAGERVNRMYLFYLLLSQAYRDHLDLNAHGTANQASLNISDMLNFLCPAPPKREQDQIAANISTILQRLDRLEVDATNAIQLMQERRTALISAAVTGKIDVRGWQAPTAN